MNKKEKEERDAWAYQMVTLQTIFTKGKANIAAALKALKMDNKRCHKIAREFRLDWVADEIEKIITI